LKKGIKTGIVSFLEDMRAIIAAYPTQVPFDIILQKIADTADMAKYIETPMIEIEMKVE
jgi:hypothetical protein